jgi:single-stranded-DNA-specific exonuclease
MRYQGERFLWEHDEPDAHVVEAVRAATGATEVLSRVMVSRGIDTGVKAEAFLDPGVHRLPDVHLLPDAEAVVGRVRHALFSEERICVHGHDDADGVTATTVMTEALAQLGMRAATYIPDRRTEGHGLNVSEIDRLADERVRLIITVDSCVSDVDEIDHARSKGIDVVVTDHHEIPPALPRAAGIVNPKLESSSYPYALMAGAGVALRVAELLLDELGGTFASLPATPPWYGPGWRDEALAVATVGTIADKVPLTGDNRSIVASGLAALAKAQRPGLRAILEDAGLTGKTLDVGDVREAIAPLFGRVSDGSGGNPALDLMLETDDDRALILTARLRAGRDEWKAKAQAAWKAASESLQRADGPVIVTEVDAPVEVLGYVTSRLADEAGVPAFVLARTASGHMAEARGPEGFDLVAALRSMNGLFDGYGGHPRAAGFTIGSDRLEAFREGLGAYVSEHPPEPSPRRFDAVVGLDAAGLELARDLDRMAPFGQGHWPAALFAPSVTPADLDAARERGVRFLTPPPVTKKPFGMVYRLRESGGAAGLSVVDLVRSGRDA